MEKPSKAHKSNSSEYEKVKDLQKFDMRFKIKSRAKLLPFKAGWGNRPL